MAPLPGAISQGILVAVAASWSNEGDGLVVLEAMKMEHTLRAGGAGTVSDRSSARRASRVDVGDLLVAVEPAVSGSSGNSTGARQESCAGGQLQRFLRRPGLRRRVEMVEGGPIDVLTGDWLAELTMYILHKTRERSGGFARTFLRQLEEVLPTCLERGITIVANVRRPPVPEGLAAPQ